MIKNAVALSFFLVGFLCAFYATAGVCRVCLETKCNASQQSQRDCVQDDGIARISKNIHYGLAHQTRSAHRYINRLHFWAMAASPVVLKQSCACEPLSPGSDHSKRNIVLRI
jgi:hypothetical protein